MRIRHDDLIRVLSSKQDWVDAAYLADTFGVTTRTIRNYIKAINTAPSEPYIRSSHKGYQIENQPAVAMEKTILPMQAEDGRGASGEPERASLSEDRVSHLLRKLISSDSPVNVYWLADEMCVSDSSLESLIKTARDSIRLFGLSLTRRRDLISIEGSEIGKRRLIGQLLTVESPIGFTKLTGNGIVSEGYDVASLTRTVSHALTSQELHTDDYGLGNILMHLIVMIDRIRQGKSMPPDESVSRARTTSGYAAAHIICSDVNQAYNLHVSESEICYLSLIVSSNSNKADYSFVEDQDLTAFLDQRAVSYTQAAIRHLEQAYYLEPFDNNFVTRMAIHVQNPNVDLSGFKIEMAGVIEVT